MIRLFGIFHQPHNPKTMSKLLSIKLDVTKIPKDRIFAGEKGKYIDLDIWINDDPDDYGNNCSANVRQTKEEREAKAKKIYVGNGKTVLGFDDKPAQSGQQPRQRQQPPLAATNDNLDEDPDSIIPF